jgi:predicted RNase H-like HicB family nuclease
MKMKNNHDDFDGFTIKIFLDEDGDYLAHFIELPNVSAFGPTPAQALIELKTAWELMKECYQEDNVPVPQVSTRELNDVPFNVPVDPQLYHRLTDEAAKAGMSLHALVTQKLAETTSVDT